jgi:phage/plasmid primase-like uncharacterized protein
MMMTVAEVLVRLPDRKRIGGGWRAACPAHGGKDLNLSVWEGDGGFARFKCFSHNCTTAEIVAALKGMPIQAYSFQPAMRTMHANDEERAEWARTIWRRTRPAPGTLVDDYLFGRRLIGNIPAAIRFHPALRHSSALYFPAMVAAVEDRGGKIVGIHRTFLKPDGTDKATVEPNKKALGSYRGCAVHLAPAADRLVICEGIETGLSILQATGLLVWAALGTANLGQVELPDFVREIMIAADHDEPGMIAARAAADAYRANGYQVHIVSPRTDKSDWNDVLRG